MFSQAASPKIEQALDARNCISVRRGDLRPARGRHPHGRPQHVHQRQSEGHRSGKK